MIINSLNPTTTKVLKTKVGADPQARWVAIPLPKEVEWTTVVRRKANQKV